MGHRSRWEFALLATMTCHTGCSQVLGLDDFSTARDAAAQVGGDAEPSDEGARRPSFPPGPEPFAGEVCTSCLSRHCSELSDRCAAGSCAAVFDRVRADARAHDSVRAFVASNVTPIEGLSTLSWFDYSWLSLGGEVDGRAADAFDLKPFVDWNQFIKCALVSCRDECEFGRDFSCVGAHALPEEPPPELRVRAAVVDVLEGVSVPAGEIKVCRVLGCNAPLQRVRTDARGLAEFVVQVPPNGVPDLAFELDCGPDYDSWINRPTFAWQSPWTVRLPVVQRVRLSPLFGKNWWDRDFDPERTYYLVSPLDCRGPPAYRVTVEVLVRDEESSQLVACDDCARVLYPDNMSLPLPTAAEHRTLGTYVFVGFVPSGGGFVVVRDSDTRQVISGYPLRGQPGAWHVVDSLFPATRAQWLALPDELRSSGRR